MNLYVFIYYLKKIENLNVYMLYKIHYFTLTVLFIAQMDALLNEVLSNSSNTPLLSYIPAQMLEVFLLYIGIIVVLIGVSQLCSYLFSVQCWYLFLSPVSLPICWVIQMLIDTIPYGCIGAVILFFSLIICIFIKQDYDRNQKYNMRKNN